MKSTKTRVLLHLIAAAFCCSVAASHAATPAATVNVAINLASMAPALQLRVAAEGFSATTYLPAATSLWTPPTAAAIDDKSTTAATVG